LPERFPDLRERAKLVARDPVAAALFFDIAVNAFMTCLLGYTEHPEKVESGKELGVAGRVRLFYAGKETQKKGSLHLHSLIWVAHALFGEKLRNRLRDDVNFRLRFYHFADDLIKESLPHQFKLLPNEQKVRQSVSLRVSDSGALYALSQRSVDQAVPVAEPEEAEPMSPGPDTTENAMQDRETKSSELTPMTDDAKPTPSAGEVSSSAWKCVILLFLNVVCSVAVVTRYGRLHALESLTLHNLTLSAKWRLIFVLWCRLCKCTAVTIAADSVSRPV
jgi:hypothetical protein